MLQTKRIYRIALLSCLSGEQGHTSSQVPHSNEILRRRHMKAQLEIALRTKAAEVRFDPEVTMTLADVITTFFGGTVDDMPEFCDQAGIVFMTNVTYRAKGAR